MSDNATPAKVRLTDGLGLEPERATMRLTLADLGVLAATAERNGTQHAFQAVALQWCGQAQAEIERLRMDLENTRGEARLAVAAERKRCAEVAYAFLDDPFLSGHGYATGCRDAILAGSET